MVPLTETTSGDIIQPTNTDHPFMRGIMAFDDYNYNQINDYVLIEEPEYKLKR